MQNVGAVHETSLTMRNGLDKAPPLVEDHLEPSHAKRLPVESLAMQNEIVGHETVGDAPT